MRSLIDHKKVFVLALNGPGVGGGAAWFQGIADIILASETTYLQVPFNSLALVPESGSSTNLARHMGVHRANDFLMFGRKLTVQELESWGLVNRVFSVEGFHNSVIEFLEKQLDVNDGVSMMETKRLQNLPLRSERILAVYNATDALSERLASGAPAARFRAKKAELEGMSVSCLCADYRLNIPISEIQVPTLGWADGISHETILCIPLCGRPDAISGMGKHSVL